MKGPETVAGLAFCVWCGRVREEWEMTMHKAGACSGCVDAVKAANLLLARAGVRAVIRPASKDGSASDG